MKEKIERLADASRRLHLILTDEEGKGMMSWHMAVNSLMTEVQDLILMIRTNREF